MSKTPFYDALDADRINPLPIVKKIKRNIERNEARQVALKYQAMVEIGEHVKMLHEHISSYLTDETYRKKIEEFINKSKRSRTKPKKK